MLQIETAQVGLPAPDDLLGVSAGLAVGPARLILNTEAAFEREIVSGDILVAPFTDTPWTPLFIPAAAVVVETGGMLSHAATVAREEGLKQLLYWVGTDNGRAVAFASSFGFRPTDSRRPMRLQGVDAEDAEAEEMMMVYPLADAAGVPTSL